MGQANAHKALEKLVGLLDPYVRDKYLELWQAVHEHRDPE
jgi:hypothetical protein